MSINHEIAKLLYVAWEKKVDTRIIADLKEALDARLFRAYWRLLGIIERIDDRASCPHCGKSTMLVELEKLKTYCFSCSIWGLDPSIGEQEEDAK